MRKLTGYFVLIIIVVCIAWDVFVITKGGKNASISQFLIDWFYDYPIASTAFGILIGHLCWQMPQSRKYKRLIEEKEKIIEDLTKELKK